MVLVDRVPIYCLHKLSPPPPRETPGPCSNLGTGYLPSTYCKCCSGRQNLELSIPKIPWRAEDGEQPLWTVRRWTPGGRRSCPRFTLLMATAGTADERGDMFCPSLGASLPQHMPVHIHIKSGNFLLPCDLWMLSLIIPPLPTMFSFSSSHFFFS